MLNHFLSPPFFYIEIEKSELKWILYEMTNELGQYNNPDIEWAIRHCIIILGTQVGVRLFHFLYGSLFVFIFISLHDWSREIEVNIPSHY